MTEEAPKKTQREQLDELLVRMKQTEVEAVREAADLFASADMNVLTEKLRELQQQTVPGSAYDQVLSSLLNVIGSTTDLFARAVAPPVDPTVVENQPVAPNGSAA